MRYIFRESEERALFHRTFADLRGSSRLTLTSSHGLSVTRTYDQQHDLLTNLENQFNGTLISQYGYKYDELHRREWATNSGDAFTASGEFFDSYDYNDRSELTGSHRFGGTDPNNTNNMILDGQFDYAYDTIGNRESMTEWDVNFFRTTTYTSNPLNQYTNIDMGGPTSAPISDVDGNLTNDGTFLYDYDAENRLISATPLTPQAGDLKADYAYDYMSRRVKKVVSAYDGNAWVTETEKYFVYDGWTLIREDTTTDSGTSTEYYVWGLDLSGTLQGAGGIGGLLAMFKENTSETLLYLYSANGNVAQLINAQDGSISARYEYDPFGNLLVSDGPEAQNNPFRFSTKYLDAETGLYYYGYRYYDPGLGRWLTRDPLGEDGGLNLYEFVRNNPTRFTDFVGLLSQEEEILRGLDGKVEATFSEHALRFMLGLYMYHDTEIGRKVFEKDPSKYPNKRWTDCITYVERVLRYAYNMTGQPHVAKQVNNVAASGIHLAQYLRTQGWKVIYWNQDINHPSDGDDEKAGESHVWAWKTYKWRKEYGHPTSVKVDDAVINYNPTSETHPGYRDWSEMSTCPTQEDLSGYNKLKNVMFGVIMVRGADHNFLYSFGKTYEVHYTSPGGSSLYEKKDFRTLNWLDGIVIVPPDNGVY